MDTSELKNLDMERAILKICMDNKSLLAEISRLKPDDFYSQTHQLVYESMLEMFEDGEIIDNKSIIEYMHRAGRLNNLSIEYINNTWILYPVSQGSLQHYVDVVLELSTRRQMYWYFDDVKNHALEIGEDVNTILMQVSARLLDFQQLTNKEEIYSFGDTFTDILTANPMGLRTGFKQLDKMTMGMKPGNLIVLAGRPGMGKTAFALNIVANVCKAGKSCFVMSLEMTEQELKERLIHSELGMSRKDLLRKKYEDEEKSRLDNLAEVAEASINEWDEHISKVKAMDGWKLKIMDKSTNNLLDLRNEALKMQAKCGLDFIVIDYLQLMSVEGFKNNRVQEITHITTHLKNMAKEMGVPILLLSQLSRGVESRSEKRPTLADLRDSGSIEQDADKVLFIYREGYYNKKVDNDETEIIIEKQRGGVRGSVPLKFEGKYTRFVDTDALVGEKANRSEKAQVKGAFN